jgi:signal transduction histidine kinase
LNDGMKDMMKIGLESDNKAVDMVQEVLKASSLRTGQMTYDFQEVPVVDFIKEIAEGFRETAVAKGLGYEVNLPTDNNLKFKIDKLQMTQVIKNLIDNSVKYTPTGTIKINLTSEGQKILFTVKDNGIGLSDDDKSKLFKEGGRGEESMKVNVNSTGYGLFIVKKIVEGHGGKIWAESAGRGHGSTFYVQLNLEG